uniref:MAM domain-containing protein n=1 Tax=Strigamia maritima TaxID=126957 RepID=T1J3D5_STRMM
MDDHATLISPWLPAGKHCTHFWFYSTSVGAVLNIHKLKHGNAEEPLATFESIRQYSWLSASVEANDSSTFEISFEAIPGPRESNLVFALDDIDFTPGSCSSRNFCDFEKDLCFWQIDDDSDIKWERSNGYEIRKNNYNNLPDHTLKLPSGHTLLIETYYEMNSARANLMSPIVSSDYNCFSFWYFTNNVTVGHFMYAAAKGSPTDKFSTAKLHSPRYEYASTTCHMTFWIFFPRDANDRSLDVSIVYLTADKPLKITSVDGIAEQWTLISVYIGSEQKPFRIEFEASNYYRDIEYIAIDDINMIDCSLKTKESETCNANEIRCSDNPKSSCINLSQKCDFNVDCIDSTDETDCTNYTMCDFEDNNMCVWTTVWQGWNLRTASTYLQPRDHTTNSQEGSYLVADYINKNHNKISSRTFKAGNCTMRLHYLLGGGGRQLFRVTTTTATNPEKVWFYKDRKWDKYFIRDEIQFNVDSDFIIALEADINYYSGYIIVDDISFDTDCQFADKELDGTVPTVCMEGQFACGDDTCIPKTSVCNFEKDCKDGSDEDNCGTCDFEDGECGWADSSVGMYRWKKTQGLLGTTSSPVSTRHRRSTNKSKWLMSVVRTTNAYSAIPNAYLESAVLGSTATTCKFIFEYHTKDIDGKFKLNVRNLAKGLEKTIAILNNSENENWIKLTIPLGGFQPGYQIVFEADVTRGHFESDVPDFAVDDIQFINCSAVAEMTNPTYSDLNCTFENGNTCNWYQELAADALNWQTTIAITNGTGPGKDHTNNDKDENNFETNDGGWVQTFSNTEDKWNVIQVGYVVRRAVDHTTGTKYGHALNFNGYDNSTAIVSNPTSFRSSASGSCFQFWYMMTDNKYSNIVVAKIVNSTRIHKAYTTYNPYEWHFGQVTIPPNKDFKIDFRATVWDYNRLRHSFFLDDFIIRNKSCLPDGSCDFESSSCGWSPNYAFQQIKWLRSSAATPSKLTGPAVDATGNPDGFYLFLDSVLEFSGEADLRSPELQTESNTTCFSFSYHISGPDVGSLRVEVILSNYESIEVFRVTGPREKKWIPVHLEIHNLTEYYFIRIVGVLNRSPMGNIAIDNFTVTSDICPQKLVLPPITTTTLRTTITTPSTTLKIKPVTTKQPTKKTTKSTTTKIITKPIEKSTTQRLSKTSTPSSLICADNEHSCRLNGKCIKSVYWCDGNKDCPGGEDEAKCEERKCSKETFSCASEPGKCIEKKRLCDGSFDCTDKSDESQCECYTDLCLNKAICTKQDKLAVCNCADNYHGNRCQFEALTKPDEKPSNLGWVAAVVLLVVLVIVAGTIFYFKKYRNPNVTENTPMIINNPMFEAATEAPEYHSFQDPDTTIPSGLDETDRKRS